MPPEVDGTGESQPADDIRSALASAIADHEVETPAPKVEVKAAAPEPELPLDGEEKPEGERKRGPDGKFAKTEAEEKAQAKPEAKTDGETEPKPDAKPTVLEPPVNWKASDKEAFKKLPTDAQRILVDRQKDMDADYTRKTQAIAALKNEYEPVDKMFEPYRDVMKQKGFTPRTLIEAWANVEKKLADNPVEVISGLVRGYKVDPAKLAATLGIKAQPAVPGEQPQPEQTIQLPPEFLAELNQLKQQVGGLTSAQQATLQKQQADKEAGVMTEIEQFKSAKDKEGNLLRPHFDEVEEHMTRLALAAKATGQPLPPLPELYETAVWANPSTREKLRTAETQQAENKRKDEARAKAAAAKKASSSVTGAPGPGQAISQGRQSDKSLREQLEEAAEDSLSAA